MDENSKKTALRETLQSLRTPGELYVIMSGATKLPFVVCNPETFDDEILLYHREEDAKNKAKELTEAHYLAGVAKLVDDQLLAFYTSLYLMGVNGLSVNVGTDQEKRVQLKDLVVRQNMKEAGEGKMIVENPEMHLTAIYLMQELRHQTGGDGSDQRTAGRVTGTLSERHISDLGTGGWTDSGSEAERWKYVSADLYRYSGVPPFCGRQKVKDAGNSVSKDSGGTDPGCKGSGDQPTGRECPAYGTSSEKRKAGGIGRSECLPESWKDRKR